jgi:ketosteroid isomerase-like protein
VGSRNVETVNAAIELLNRGEIDEVFERYAAEDIIWDYSQTIGPDQAGVYRGLESAKRFARELFVEPWEEFEFVADEYVEVDSDRLVMASHTRTVGRAGIEVIARGAVLFEFDDAGKLAAMRLFQSKEEALEAARAA